jgi:hypothetical protein
MVRREKISRAAGLFLAALIGIVTVGLVAHAAQLITTPNAMQIPYSLAVGSPSVPIALPVNQPVLVMGSDSDFANNGNGGVGQAVIMRSTGDNTLRSIGFDFGADAFVEQKLYGTASSGFIFALDQTRLVWVESNGKNIFVSNGDDQSSGPGQPIGHTGVVTMIW